MKRRLAAVFAVVAAALAVSGFFYHKHYQNALRAEAVKMLLSIEQIKLDQLRSWREDRDNTALSLLDGPRIEIYLRSLAADPADRTAADGLRTRLRAFITRNKFNYAAIAGHDGRPLVHTGGEPEKMCPEVTSLIAKAKASGRPELGNFYLHPGESDPHIDMALQTYRAAGGRQFFLLLRMTPSEFLYPLLQSWSAKGETGEILLVARDGDELVFLNDLRHAENAAMRLRRPLTMEELPAAMGLRGKTGIVEGLDYRGVPVIAAVGPVPGSGWALVTKLDRSEALKGAGTLAVLISLLVLSLLAAVAAGAYLLVLRQAAAYERIRINYNLFSEKANDGMLAVDLETLAVSEANRRACEMYGYPPERMSGLKLEKVIPPGDLEDFRRRVSENLRAGSRVYEVSHQRADGTVFPAEISANVAEVDGRKTMFLIVRDVSERKGAQRLLARLTDQVPGVVYQYRLYPDGRSCFPYASSGMETIYEVTSEEVREDATPAFGRIHPDDLKSTSEAIFASARDLSVFHWEFRVVLPRQGQRWRLCDARPERLPDGGTLWHGIITDVTDRKLAEAEILKLNQDLVAKNREMENFLYITTHDLRTPLVNIQGFTQNVRGYFREIGELLGAGGSGAGRIKELTEQKIPEALAFVEEGSAKMGALISSLLKVSRAGRLELKPERIDMQLLLGRVTDAMRFQLETAGARVEAGSALPPCLADPDAVSQIFSNLLDNAVKYRDPARPLLVRVTAEKKDNFSVYSVADNGRGISERELPNIWTVFARPLSARDRGEGIGLPMVKRMAERSGGRIAAESQQGAGSVFRVELPAA